MFIRCNRYNNVFKEMQNRMVEHGKVKRKKLLIL